MPTFKKKNGFLRFDDTATFYVDHVSGTDAEGKGFASGTDAWKTMSYADKWLIQNAVGNGKTVVTVNVAGNLTQTATETLVGNVAGCEYVIYDGDTTTPSNVTLTGGSAHCVTFETGARAKIRGMKLNAADTYACLTVGHHGNVWIGDMEFAKQSGTAGTCISTNRSSIVLHDDIDFSGDFGTLIYSIFTRWYDQSAKTFTGSPTYSITCQFLGCKVVVHDTLASATGTHTGNNSCIWGGQIYNSADLSGNTWTTTDIGYAS